MFKTLGSAFKNRELRKGMLITLLLLLVYRLGCFLPTPGLSADFYSEISANDNTGLLSLLNTVTGSALSNAAIFALGVTPYINSSIIVQLLAVAIPALERLSKEGEEGKQKINMITKHCKLHINHPTARISHNKRARTAAITVSVPRWVIAVSV